MNANCLRLGVTLLMSAGWTASAADDDKKNRGDKPGGRKGDPAVMFQRLDKNGDGRIVRDELEAVPEQIRNAVGKADANGDGAITREELMAAPMPGKGKDRKVLPGGGEPDNGPPGGKPDKGPPGGKPDMGPPGGKPDKGAPPGGKEGRKPGKFGGGGDGMKKMDANKDGKISRDEAQGPMANFFERIDADKDGFLSEPELRGAREKMGGKGGKKPAKVGGDQPEGKRKKGEARSADKPKGEAGPPKDGLPNLAMMIERLDSNSDGKVAKDEARGPLAENFDRLDGDKDGFLSKSEMEAVGKRMKGAGMPPGFGKQQPLLVNAFNQQDVDADGRVSKSEAKGKLLEQFDALDADKDGKLTRQEAEAGMKKVEGKGK